MDEKMVKEDKDINTVEIETIEMLKEPKKKGKKGIIIISLVLVMVIAVSLVLCFTMFTSKSEILAAVKMGNEWGYINTKGKLVMPVKYSYALGFSDGVATVGEGDIFDGTIGFVDSKGKYLFVEDAIESIIDGTTVFSEGFACVCENDKCGFINTKGDYVIDAQFDEANDFSEGLAAVKEDEKWGYINSDGDYVIDARFDEVSSFSEDMAAVCENGKWGYINKKGEMIIQPQFENAHIFSDGLAAVMLDEKYGYVNTEGKMVISCSKYEDAGDFKEGFACVCENGKWGYIDPKGEYLIEPQFDMANEFSDGMARVIDYDLKNYDEIYKYVNTDGEVIEFPYVWSGEFSQGLACVKENGMFGYINKKGEVVIEPKFDDAGRFYDVSQKNNAHEDILLEQFERQ